MADPHGLTFESEHHPVAVVVTTGLTNSQTT